MCIARYILPFNASENQSQPLLRNSLLPDLLSDLHSYLQQIYTSQGAVSRVAPAREKDSVRRSAGNFVISEGRELGDPVRRVLDNQVLELVDRHESTKPLALLRGLPLRKRQAGVEGLTFDHSSAQRMPFLSQTG